MKSPTPAFDNDQVNTLGHNTIAALADRPPLSDNILENYGERPIWDEMLAAGLVTPKTRDWLVQCCGSTLKHLINTEMAGRSAEKSWTLWAHIRRTPAMGDAKLHDIGNFIRATYGYSPARFKLEGEKPSFTAPEEPIDVSTLDATLSDQLVQRFNLEDLNISAQAQAVLSENNIQTVGDFAVLSSTTLLDKGLTPGAIKQVATAIEAQTGFSKSALVNNKVATQAVRWKYAVIKASSLAADIV